jgi:hypothetical protein
MNGICGYPRSDVAMGRGPVFPRRRCPEVDEIYVIGSCCARDNIGHGRRELVGRRQVFESGFVAGKVQHHCIGLPRRSRLLNLQHEAGQMQAGRLNGTRIVVRSGVLDRPSINRQPIDLAKARELVFRCLERG